MGCSVTPNLYFVRYVSSSLHLFRVIRLRHIDSTSVGELHGGDIFRHVTNEAFGRQRVPPLFMLRLILHGMQTLHVKAHQYITCSGTQQPRYHGEARQVKELSARHGISPRTGDAVLLENTRLGVSAGLSALSLLAHRSGDVCLARLPGQCRRRRRQALLRGH